MKKLGLILCLLLIACAFTTSAFARGPWYGAVKLGGSQVDMTSPKAGGDSAGSGGHDVVYAAGLSLGYDFKPDMDIPVRAELEYMFRTNYSKKYRDADDSIEFDSNIHTLMLNVLYDIPVDWCVKPFVGIGGGLAFIDSEAKGSTVDTVVYSERYRTTELTPALSVMAGAGYWINDALSLDLGYRYLYTGKAKLKIESVTVESQPSVHEVTLGLRYHF